MLIMKMRLLISNIEYYMYNVYVFIYFYVYFFLLEIPLNINPQSNILWHHFILNNKIDTTDVQDIHNRKMPSKKNVTNNWYNSSNHLMEREWKTLNKNYYK